MPKRWPSKSLVWFATTKYVKIRAGETHRFINVWIVVVEGRVFARSWNNKPSGWFEAFRKESQGAVQVDGEPVPILARTVRDEKTLDAVTAAFGLKYTTKPNKQYVVGFAEEQRRRNTVEFVRSLIR